MTFRAMNGMKTDSDHGQPDNREWASDSGHRETVAVGIMSVAAIVLVGRCCCTSGASSPARTRFCMR